MKLVEVVKTPITDPAVLETSKTFVKYIGKVPVLTKDRGGFLVNLLLTPFIYDAMRALDHGMGSTADIDKAMVLGCGHPIGPLKDRIRSWKADPPQLFQFVYNKDETE